MVFLNAYATPLFLIFSRNKKCAAEAAHKNAASFNVAAHLITKLGKRN